MAAIQWSTGASPSFSFGGTLTVVFLGAASGLVGGALVLMSRAAVRRLPTRYDWAQHVVFGITLLLVTLRGLRGTPGSGWWYFFVLVAVYGTTLTLLTSQRQSLPRNQ